MALLESKGIKVIEVDDVDPKKFDGLSSIIDNKYHIIVVNKSFTVERKRFTLLHELGHLLLDIDVSFDDKEKEKICHSFAGAMLLPKKSLIEEIGEFRSKIDIQEMEILQKKYGISIRATLFRLINCGIVPKHIHIKFYKLINFNKALKYRVDKKRFEGVEKSDRFKQLIFRALSQEDISISKASSLLNWNFEKLNNNISMV